MPLAADTTKPDDGRDAIAARVVALAAAHGIRLSHTADLATLLDSLGVTDPIPVAAFGVIAEVLFAILSADHPPQPEEAAP